MSELTVVAAYRDPPSIWCGEPVEADDIEEAIEKAWLDCCDGNDWEPSERDRNEEWADVMVVEGAVRAVA